MYYCDVTPGNNRGIVHLKAIVFLKNYNLEFDRDSKYLYYIDCFTGESIQISPLYEYKLVEDSKQRSKNCYEFKVALKVIEESVINYKEVNLFNSRDFEEEGCNLNVSEHKKLTELLYLDDKGFNILKGFTKGENRFKEVKFSNSSEIIWTKFQIGCRDLVILEDSLLSIDIRNNQGIYLLIFRIGIKIDKKLNFLDLKVTSLSCLSDIESLKGTKNLQLRCKRCNTELDYLTDINIYSLPSDLYLNSIGSIYCEECQDNLTKLNSDSLEDKIKLTHKNKILYISDETITVNQSLGGKHTLITSDKDSNNNSSQLSRCIKELDCNIDLGEKGISCSNCKEVIGYITNKSITYLKNKVFGISDGIDIFWRYSEYIELVEKIQYSDRINIRYSSGIESIEIIKVTRKPDTFILINNNPVLTSRVLFKIDKNNKTKEQEHKEEERIKEINKDRNNISEEVDNRLFEHIKYLLLLFSHNKDNSELIASLLPQI